MTERPEALGRMFDTLKRAQQVVRANPQDVDPDRLPIRDSLELSWAATGEQVISEQEATEFSQALEAAREYVLGAGRPFSEHPEPSSAEIEFHEQRRFLMDPLGEKSEVSADREDVGIVGSRYFELFYRDAGIFLAFDVSFDKQFYLQIQFKQKDTLRTDMVYMTDRKPLSQMAPVERDILSFYVNKIQPTSPSVVAE
ncbi:MAG: hypothetical protein HY430_00800 [Candidatus Levybacteria bacterium]|nr:hypothetical protein [Candidatus Levybacteria bacterium]